MAAGYFAWVSRIFAAKTEKTLSEGIVHAAQHFLVVLQPGGQPVGGKDDAGVDRHADQDEAEAEKEQLLGDGWIA